jgi:hypothetical protein
MQVRSRETISQVVIAIAVVLSPRSQSAQAPRESTITAVVLSDDGRRTAIAGAELTLVRTEPPDDDRNRRARQLGITGEDGVYRFERVTPGRYTLVGGKAGYISMSFGATAVDPEPAPIVVGDRGVPLRLEVKLPGGSAISGTIRSTQGSPVADASVLLLQFVGGDRHFAKMSDAANAGGVVRVSADSSGAYRLFGLPAGEYIVQATSIEHRPASDEPLMSRGYYGGGADAGSASIVNVAGGQESAGIDIQLQPVTLASVSGVVLPSPEQTRRRLRMLMFPQGLFANSATAREAEFVVSSPDGLFSNPIQIASDGAFTIGGVMPGQYEVWVRSVPANDAADDDPGPALWGRTDLSVTASNVSNVVISLQDSTVFAGRVVVDVTTAQPSRLFEGGEVVLTPYESQGTRSRSLRVHAPIGSDGAFRTTGVTPGRYTVDVHLQDPSWQLKSARSREQDLLDVPFVVQGDTGIAESVLAMSREKQNVSGTLLDASDQPLAGMRVVIFPDDRSLWLPDSRRIRTVKTATDGSFSANDLPSGAYKIGALTIPFNPATIDAQLLDALSAAAVSFSLAAGDRKVVDIRVAK